MRTREFHLIYIKKSPLPLFSLSKRFKNIYKKFNFNLNLFITRAVEWIVMDDKGDYFLLCLVFIKINNQIKLKLVKTNQGLVFLDKNRFKPIWLGFFRFGFDSVWVFWFQVYKTKTKPSRLVFLKF